MSRFTSFTENFVICCYQVTKQRLRWYDDGHRGNCVPGWSDEQRASVEFPVGDHVSSMGSVMTGSARSSSEASVCASLERPASTKSKPADKCKCSYPWADARSPSQRLDRWLPHGSRHRTCVVCEASVTTCSRRASSSQRLWIASLWKKLANRLFRLSRSAWFFLSSDRFLFANDRTFLTNDIFRWISHDFGKRDRTCLCFYLHFDFAGKTKWTRGMGGRRRLAHPQWLRKRLTTQPIVHKGDCGSGCRQRLSQHGRSLQDAAPVPQGSDRRRKLGRRIWDLDEQCIDAGSLPAPLSCARAGVRVQPSPAAAPSDEPDWCAVRAVARCEQGLLPVFTTAETGSRVFWHWSGPGTQCQDCGDSEVKTRVRAVVIGSLAVSLGSQQPFPSSPICGCGEIPGPTHAMEKKEVLDGRCVLPLGPQSRSAVRQRTGFRLSRGTHPPRRGIQRRRQPFQPSFLLQEIIFAHSPNLFA